REERLEDRESLRRDGPRRPLVRLDGGALRSLASRLGRLAFVVVADAPERRRDLASQLVGLERHRPPDLAEHPRGELGEGGGLGDEHAVLGTAGRAVRPLHPPGGLARDLDARLADDVADLPRRPAAIELDVEFDRSAEVAFAPCRELDLAADPRDAERPDVVTVDVVAD